jgi:hypothetical protein
MTNIRKTYSARRKNYTAQFAYVARASNISNILESSDGQPAAFEAIYCGLSTTVNWGGFP